MARSAYRRSVARFGKIMVAQLDANNHKDGWHDMSPAELLDRLQQEAEELAEAIYYDQPFARIQREAADVANFAMMIAEVVNGGPDRMVPEPLAAPAE